MNYSMFAINIFLTFYYIKKKVLRFRLHVKSEFT